MSGKQKAPKKPKTAREFFTDEDGEATDAGLHDAILEEGDDAAAEAVSAKVAARIRNKPKK